MRKEAGILKKTTAFALVELLIVIAILGILAAIATPGFSVWLPSYKLKSAARDLYSNMQLAKITAVRQNAECAIVFDSSVSPGRYYVCTGRGANGNWDGPPAIGGDDPVMKEVDLSVYGRDIDYGGGDATDDMSGGGAPPADPISYAGPDNIAIFSPRATVVNPGAAGGFVYLSNNRGSSYGVGTPSVAGVILLRKWTGAAWE
jgi:prepilin-type N-terminal cleavage/methylation domain-containing protein